MKAFLKEDLGPTWWQRHAHLVVMWATAIAIGLKTGLWLIAGILAAYEFAHQCVHAAWHHPTDWRARYSALWLAAVAVVLTTGFGPYRFIYWQEAGTGWALLAAVALAIAGQAVASEGWHRSAPPHRWKYQGSLLAKWPVRLLGVAAMATGVWVTSGLLG
jgi:hypothetical protein